MRGGHVDAITRRSVAGWAADTDRPDERLTVCILVNGVRLGETQADRLRKDLANLGRFGDGRHGFLFEYPQPLDPAQDHLVTVQFAEDEAKLPNGEHLLTPLGGAAAPIASPAVAMVPPAVPPLAAAKPARRRKAPSSAAEGLLPIMVTAPGRSGTTLLMGLLARSPAIVAAELAPYELRLLSYYSTVFQVLTAPADLERSTHTDRLEGDGFHIGFNPFHGLQHAPAFRDRNVHADYYDNFVPDRILAGVRDLIREYYARLAADKGKSRARYFAEKGNNIHAPTRSFVRRAFGQVRELVIVRDPRDVLCSHMAYFSSTPEKAFSQLSHAGRQLLAIRAEGRSDIHIFKYEDMVQGDAACFAGLSAFLDTDIEPEGGPRPEEVFRRHGTSVSPAASVARWRTNLPEALQARCRQDWERFLTAFGYALE